MTMVGRAAAIASATARSSKASSTSAFTPALSISPTLSAERLVPVTSYPRWSRSGVRRLPTTPLAPATKTLCLLFVMMPAT